LWEERAVTLLADANFSVGEFLLWCLWIFLFVIWFWLLITIFADVFRRRDIGGFAKTMWVIFVIILPFLGIFIYLISQHDGMAERSMEAAKAQQQQLREMVASPADELMKLDQLKANGSISDEEYQKLRARALS
jgi:ABC-type multidrug transport system fused ATPase/permease subunit